MTRQVVNRQVNHVLFVPELTWDGRAPQLDILRLATLSHLMEPGARGHFQRPEFSALPRDVFGKYVVEIIARLVVAGVTNHGNAMHFVEIQKKLGARIWIGSEILAPSAAICPH